MVLALLLVAVASLAGCNVRDWWNLEGTFKVEIAAVGPGESALGDFQKLTLAVYQVSLKQEGELNTHLFAFQPEPLAVDLVELHESGKGLPVAEMKKVIRPVTATTIRISVVEAIDASGRSLPACYPGEPVESRPCVSAPRNGAYTVDDHPFSPPRGGAATFRFPFAVQYSPQANEYYIQADPALVEIVTED